MESVLAGPAPISGRAHAAHARSSWPAAWASAAVHVAAVGALVSLLSPRPLRPPPKPISFTLVMAPAETGEVMGSANLPAAELRPAAAYVTAGLAAPAPVLVAPADRASLRIPRPRPVPHAAVPANAGAAPARPLSRPAPAPDRFTPSPVLSAALLAGLEARIQQAVQNAAVYPPSARMMHVEGRTRLRFDYTDGAVGMAGVVISSNSAILDRAALDAVRRAELPRAPAEIGKRTLPLLVWVDFRLVRQD